MKKELVVLTILIFLLTFLFLGSPIEFCNVTWDIIGVYIIDTLCIILFISCYYQISKFKNNTIKWIGYSLTSLILLPYIFIGIWTLAINGPDFHPMWEDTDIYINNNEKIVSQFRETSGSIHDYRNRKIIANYGSFRISYDCNIENLNDDWKKIIQKTDSITALKKEKKEKKDIGLSFINDYIKYLNNTTSGKINIVKWVHLEYKTTQLFESKLNSILIKANKLNLETSIDFDPILQSQDYPTKGFELDYLKNEKNYVILKGINWSEFKVKIVLKIINGAWLINEISKVN